MLDQGTVVALATPEGKGGLAVVRLSGSEALATARRLIRDGSLDDPVDSHRARLTTLFDADGQIMDEALVLPLVAPASYTGEDTVEFFCHGGVMPARLVMAACRAAGAVAAGAGEFTRRAFLNGRLSLAQAEAVADLIESEHKVGARAALAQLQGGLNREVAAIEDPLRALLANLEGSLEFGDDDDPGPGPDLIQRELLKACERIDGLLALAPAGRHLREGVQVVLAGPPNVGKSSLFNALLAHDRALVDPEAGTTRDVVTERMEIDGLLFVLHDTAGLRDLPGVVEAKGIALTRDMVSRADIVLDLRPAGADESTDDLPNVPPGCTVLPVGTKGDLASGSQGLVTSSVTGRGVDELRQTLLRLARQGGVPEAVAHGVVLNQRHLDRLNTCREALERMAKDTSASVDVQATMLAAALQELGAISGRVFTEQLLGDIFSRFCVGK